MRRRRYHQPEEVVARKCASVHILRTEEELEAAVQRAEEFDRRAAAVLENRFRHYRELATTSAATESPAALRIVSEN